MEYYHDEENKIVYAIDDLTVKENKNKRSGKVIEYFVHTKIKITRADGKYPVRRSLSQTFEGNDGRAFAIDYFKTNHYPGGNKISIEEYNKLREKYDREAKENGN